MAGSAARLDVSRRCDKSWSPARRTADRRHARVRSQHRSDPHGHETKGSSSVFLKDTFSLSGVTAPVLSGRNGAHAIPPDGGCHSPGGS